MKQNKNIKVLIKSILVNTSLVILKILAGIFGNSKALIADGIHSFSDLGTDILGILGFKLSARRADQKHPYGHGMIEYLFCLAISLIVIVLGVSIITSSLAGNKNIPSNITILVTLVTITLKYILATYLMKKGKEYNNSLLIASGKESKADVSSSVIVLFALLASKLTKYSNIFTYSDTVGAIILGLFTITTGIRMFFENLTTLLGEKETNEDINNYIKEIILSFNGVKQIKELVLLKFGSYYKCELNIMMDPQTTIRKSNILINKLTKELKQDKTGIKYVNIIVSPYKR